MRFRHKGDDKPEKERPKPKNWLHALWLNWIKPIGLAVLVVFGFRSMFIDWNDVPSSSMEPTILVGDRIFVNKLAFGLQFPFSKFFGGPWWIATWGGPDRGDIVVFFATQREGGGMVEKRLVKRVIGLPGDTIELRDNVIYINNQEVEYQEGNAGKYARLDLHGVKPENADFKLEPLGDVLHAVMLVHRDPRYLLYADYGPKVIPDDHYLMMGDNRNNSRDGRQVDGLPAEQNGFGFVTRDQIVGRAFGVAFSIDKVPSFRFRWERFFRGFGQEDVTAPAN